jgi:hypothetical protein
MKRTLKGFFRTNFIKALVKAVGFPQRSLPQLPEGEADEGSLSAETDPSPVLNELRSFDRPSPSRGEGKDAAPALHFVPFSLMILATAEDQP